MTFEDLSRRTDAFVSTPQATAFAVASVFLWAALGPHYHFSETWQIVINTGTTIVTFLMVFVLSSAQARNQAALHRKLDGLIAGVDKADDRLVGIENLPAEVVAELVGDLPQPRPPRPSW